MPGGSGVLIGTSTLGKEDLILDIAEALASVVCGGSLCERDDEFDGIRMAKVAAVCRGFGLGKNSGCADEDCQNGRCN
jgi:hypothetical protein